MTPETPDGRQRVSEDLLAAYCADPRDERGEWPGDETALQVVAGRLALDLRDARAQLAEVTRERDRLAEEVNWAAGELLNGRTAREVADALFASKGRSDWQTALDEADNETREAVSARDAALAQGGAAMDLLRETDEKYSRRNIIANAYDVGIWIAKVRAALSRPAPDALRDLRRAERMKAVEAVLRMRTRRGSQVWTCLLIDAARIVEGMEP